MVLESKLKDENEILDLAQKNASVACDLTYIMRSHPRMDLPKYTVIGIRSKRVWFRLYKTAKDHSQVLNAVQQMLDKYDKNINMSEGEIISKAWYVVSLTLPHSKYARAVCGDDEIEDGIIDVRVPGTLEKIESEFLSLIKSFTNGKLFMLPKDFMTTRQR